MVGQRRVKSQGTVPKGSVKSRLHRRNQVVTQVLRIARTPQGVVQIGAVFVSLDHLTSLGRVLALDAAQVGHRV